MYVNTCSVFTEEVGTTFNNKDRKEFQVREKC